MTSYQIGVLLGVASAFTATAVMLWAREIQHREGPWRYMAIITLGPALLGAGSWLIAPPAWSGALIAAAVAASIPAMAGMFLLGLAANVGHVSHIAPAMGSRVLIITILAATLGYEPTPPRFWLAAAILLVALFLVNGSPEILRKPWRVADRTLCLTLLSCASFALADLITRRRLAEHQLGAWEFLTVSWVFRGSLMLGAYVSVCTLRRKRLLLKNPLTFWASAPFFCVHGLFIVGAFKLTDSAVLVNVLTNFRGVTAVLAVVLLARVGWTRNETLTRSVFLARFLGALMVLAAIGLALAG